LTWGFVFRNFNSRKKPSSKVQISEISGINVELNLIQLAMKLKIYTFLTLLFILTACLHAQDYKIRFAGSGAATTVETVKVENLTQGTEITMNGSDVLHLKGTVTGIETVHGNTTGKIIFYPNPMDDFTRMEFALPESGETLISLYDISGRKIARKQDFLSYGQHTYELHGIGEGICFVSINSGSFALNGRLISSGSNSGNAKIVYAGSGETGNLMVSQEKQSDSKGANAEIVMQYNDGERLKLTGIYDIYSTVITDVPRENKTITFNFIACTDGDGNNYSTVKIGDQVWMAENLKYLPSVVGPGTGSETAPYYYVYGYNGTNVAKAKANSNYQTYGVLYNWRAAMNGKPGSSANPSGVQGVCPTGWHLPSDAEWSELTDNLGGESIAGDKLKESGTVHWNSPNTGATNETGFTALPGGLRYLDGAFINVESIGYWWSATEFSIDNAWVRDMSYTHGDVDRGCGSKEYGLSVRCVRD
jgi:uncharacterized protein (TIGR02145 family)